MTTIQGNVISTITPVDSASIYGDTLTLADATVSGLQALDAQFKVTPMGTGSIKAVSGVVPIVNFGINTVTIASGKGGSGYTSVPAVTLSGDQGNGDAVLTAVLTSSGSIKSVAVGGSGEGYTYGDQLTFSGGGGAGAAGYIVTQWGGNITAAFITNGGSGYTSAPTVGVATAGGSGNTLTATVGKAVASVTVSAAGTGFAHTPAVVIAAPANSGVTATATATMKSIAAIVALTLAAPVPGMPSEEVLVSTNPNVYAPGQDGQSITLIDTIGQAHTVTTTSGPSLTFGGTVGQVVSLVAYNGVWYQVGGFTPLS